MPPVRPCGVKQRRARAALAAGAECDPPHARRRDGKPPAVRPAAAAARVDVDPPAAEVRHEQVAAESAETGRRKRDSPRLVELARATDACDEPAVEVELVHVAAGRRVVAVHRCAPGVRDEDPPPDRLDPEGRIPRRDRAVDERAAPDDAPPARAEDEHAGVVEVRCVEAARRQSEPAEHGRCSACVDRHLGLRRPAMGHGGRPAPDHPVLARVQEPRGRGRTAAANDKSPTAVEDDPGRPAGDADRHRLLPPVARVQRARAPRFVGDPPRSFRARREPPRVYELRVRAVGDEPVQDEPVRSGAARRAGGCERRESDRDRAGLHLSAWPSATVSARRAGSRGSRDTSRSCPWERARASGSRRRRSRTASSSRAPTRSCRGGSRRSSP